MSDGITDAYRRSAELQEQEKGNKTDRTAESITRDIDFNNSSLQHYLIKLKKETNNFEIYKLNAKIDYRSRMVKILESELDSL